MVLKVEWLSDTVRVESDNWCGAGLDNAEVNAIINFLW